MLRLYLEDSFIYFKFSLRKTTSSKLVVYIIISKIYARHSLFFYFIGCCSSYILGVRLCFAAMPQVDEGFVDIEDNHGCPGPQAAAVTRYFK